MTKSKIQESRLQFPGIVVLKNNAEIDLHYTSTQYHDNVKDTT